MEDTVDIDIQDSMDMAELEVTMAVLVNKLKLLSKWFPLINSTFVDTTGFRSADQEGENGDKPNRRKRSDEANKESSGGDVQGRSGGETDPRFLGAIGGMFGKS